MYEMNYYTGSRKDRHYNFRFTFREERGLPPLQARVCVRMWHILKKTDRNIIANILFKKNGKSRIAINDSWKFYFSFYFQQLNVSWLQVFKRLKNANIWQHFIHWYNNKLNQELSLMTRYKSYQYNPILSFQHEI